MEVPRQVEVVDGDAGGVQAGEDVLVPPGPVGGVDVGGGRERGCRRRRRLLAPVSGALALALAGAQALARQLAPDGGGRRRGRRFVGVAEGGEGRRRGQLGPVGVAQVPEGDDVAATLLEVGQRTDDEGAVPSLGEGDGVLVELGPVRVALAGVGVEQHDRSVGRHRQRRRFDHGVGQGITGGEGVVGRRRAGAGLGLGVEAEGGREVQSGDEGQDHRPGREAVVAVPLGRVHRLGAEGARGRQRGEGHPTAGRASTGPAGELVVRERQQAEAGVEVVARAGWDAMASAARSAGGRWSSAWALGRAVTPAATSPVRASATVARR